MTSLAVLIFLLGGFLRADGAVLKVTGTGQLSANNKKLTLVLNLVNGGATPAGPTPAVVTSGGGTPGQVAPTNAPSTGSKTILFNLTLPFGNPLETLKSGLLYGPTKGYSQFERDALKEHNKFRATHLAPPMTLDREMCDQAAAFAQKLADRGGLMHSAKTERAGQGENLSMGCSTLKGQTVTEAVENWYNEVCSPGYTFMIGKGQSGTGHFTQVVWKASTVLGIGKADIDRNGMKCTYFVGRYKPLGNFDTGNQDYIKNVLKGTFDSSVYCPTVGTEFKDGMPGSPIVAKL